MKGQTVLRYYLGHKQKMLKAKVNNHEIQRQITHGTFPLLFSVSPEALVSNQEVLLPIYQQNS